MNHNKSDHPYRHLNETSFWKNIVESNHPLDITNWYKKKFTLDNKRIGTAGSCFAQHIGRELRLKGFNFVDTEPAPAFLKQTSRLDYGYGMYSARYGNIYNTRQLLQLLQRALNEFTPVESYWKKDNGFVDPFRPTIEPEPFDSVEELDIVRNHHLKCVVDLFEKTDVFVFTLGLTEAWINKNDAAVYPICPGVSGGEYSDTKYKFSNFNFPEIRNDLESFFTRVRQINSKMRFILTVSPVPLIATATNRQVVVANMHSKSILRAVAGFLSEKFYYVDYFPSYEIINSHVMKAQFYNPDMRTVHEAGVKHVMEQFFKEHTPPSERKPQNDLNQINDLDDIACDEELLAVFGSK